MARYGQMTQYVFFLGPSLSQLWHLHSKCLLNEGELKKLTCIETDTVLAGAVWIQHQVFASSTAYNFLMQGTLLVLEEIRFDYDYLFLQCFPCHDIFCTFACWLREDGRFLGHLILCLSLLVLRLLISTPCSPRTGLFGVLRMVNTYAKLSFQLKIRSG